LLPSWSLGTGGARDLFGGNGAGGFGGGGGGSDNPCGPGGGGGGSWAAGTMLTDPAAAPFAENPSSPNGTAGAVQLSYVAPDRPILYRVNAGGPKIASTDKGPAWVPDTAYLTGGGDATPSTTHAIDLKHHRLTAPCLSDTTCGATGGGAPEDLFKTGRSDSSGGSEMKYSFPVTSGDPVEIRLLFAEIADTYTTPNKRIFNVKVEGTTVFGGVDPVGLAGSNYRGTRLSSITTISDGSIDIEFDHVTDNPLIQGIEIRGFATNFQNRGLLRSTGHPAATDCLTTGDAGVLLTNSNTGYRLVWQPDGDLVSPTATWCSTTARDRRSGDRVPACGEASCVFKATVIWSFTGRPRPCSLPTLRTASAAETAVTASSCSTTAT